MANEHQELNPKDQREQDEGRVQSQLGVTDAFQQVSSVMDVFGLGGSRPGLLARTSFESHELNAMIDLVESANPADMESAGTALWKARDALRDAARELQDYIDKVEWKGESGNEFRSFGRELAEHARSLGTFADAAGTQITVAGTGLASVHKSMPPRDGRQAKKSVEDIEAPGRIEGNPEYDAAVKVEKDRQEAINQMNRLASFYAVSAQTLETQEPPKFHRTLKASVPPPSGSAGPGPTPGSTPASPDLSGVTAPQSVAVSNHTDASGTGGTARAEAIGTVGPGAVTPVPDRSPSMAIDSVAAPPAPTTSLSAPPVSSATGPPSPAGGATPPIMAGGFVNPVKGGAAHAAGATGRPRAAGQNAGTAGRQGAAGGGSAAAVRAGGAGRPGPLSSGPAAMGRAGAAGPVGSAGHTPAAGRSGAAGQPMAGHAGTGGSAAPRAAGSANGIVGGNPQRTAAGSSTPRLPRGTVIGGEATASGRTAGRAGQQGVFGAHPASGASGPGGRGTASSNGVVGTPRSSAPGSRPGAGGFSQGGAGLVRGPAGQRQTGNEEQERTGSPRPDYLTEDEETWAARRRGTVPPVIE